MTIRILILALVAIGLVACSAPRNANQQDQRVVDEQQRIYQTNQPVPMFNWSQERDTLIQLYVMQNESRQTYTVIQSQGTGQTLFECPSRGTALPADTQLTNPLQISVIQPQGATSWYADVVEQAEPNGTYSSKNTDATWIMCVRANGEIAPVYTEQKVTQFPFAVRWDPDRQRYVDAEGPTSMRIDLNRGAGR